MKRPDAQDRLWGAMDNLLDLLSSFVDPRELRGPDRRRLERAKDAYLAALKDVARERAGARRLTLAASSGIASAAALGGDSTEKSAKRGKTRR